ncbi:MAG: HPr kinase/phosphatase C-terminal domain-containing protein [Marinibacterium sp.]|nr:HPr kinase/phosphatase C-terminal domain-containing protein [Marinibacterium sp.]
MSEIRHATAVAVAGRALLITGASGAGKSSLALRLMGLGAVLVSDDRVILHRDGDRILAHAPDAIRGLIEARGLGLLRAAICETAQIVALVDLDRTETERLPSPRTTEILGIAMPLLQKSEMTDFPAALVQYLKCGRKDPE